MTHQEHTPAATVDDAFALLARLVGEWRPVGRKTTTAGLKPAMQVEISGFNEQNFGFSTFREFVEAAERAGYVRIERLNTGHALILLPGEELGTVPATNAPALAASVRGIGAGRLKSDVWMSFVDWRDSHERLWDRQAHRSFVYPVDGNGDPAWTTEPERFVDVRPVDQEMQVGWMREWAETLQTGPREMVLGALANDRPLGQFREALKALGLAQVWRVELQRRVLEHVTRWAGEHEIQMHELLDPRPAPAPVAAPARPGVQPAAPVALAPPVVPGAAPAVRRPPAPSGDDVTALRALLHRVIDRMSLSELASIPVRAEHLLDR